MADPFNIRIFVPDGDPGGEVRQRPEVQRTGVYILVGYTREDVDLPIIGQADVDNGSIFSNHSAFLCSATVPYFPCAPLPKVCPVMASATPNGMIPRASVIHVWRSE